jgi:calcineurin-like phosphoesterase family protein
MTNVFYTSDLHIGHELVAIHRGFSYLGPVRTKPGEEHYDALVQRGDTEAHDAHLAGVWDASVDHDDIVWVLGDISINGGQHALDWIAERPGTKHLIAGNHDPVGPWDRRAPKKMKHWMNYFESIQPMARRRLEGINFMLSHFPYWPHDRHGEEPRYEQYRVPNLGLPLLHGHTHDPVQKQFPNSLHVGWDAWGQLVPQEYVQDWLKSL